MPLNEASGFRRSNLTKQQRREAEAAIYGLQPQDIMSPQFQLTDEEIERMRAIVMAHDREGGKVKEFDLNNPPTPPYVFKEYPKTLFHHATRKLKVVATEVEQKLWLAKGWSVKPFRAEGAEESEIELDPAAAAEAAEVDAKIVAQKKSK